MAHVVQIKKNVLVKGRTKTVKTLTYVSAKSDLGCNITNTVRRTSCSNTYKVGLP